MNNDTVEFVLFDTDLTTALGILPAGSMKLDLILNEPGSGEVKIPLKSKAAGLVTSTMFASGKYRGGTRGGFFVENIGKDLATSGENEAQWLSISGRGALALLDDAMVDYDGTSATTRDLSGTRAGMLIDLIVEAQARGALQNLDYDFTDTLDSDGNAWSDNDPLKWTVGTSLLDVARQISKIGIDFDIVPDGVGGFVLSAYKNGKGADKSNTVYFRVGVNCEEVSSLEAGGEIRNALRVGYKAGYTAVSDSTSITTYRRREKLLDARAAQTTEAALTYGGAELSMSKDPKKSITVKVYDGKGPRAFVDYALGDSITLDVKGVETTYRVRGMQLAWDGKKFADVFVELNSIILENEIRMAQDIGWLLDEWATARDANLLAVSFWAGIGGDADYAGEIYCSANIGRKIYFGGASQRIANIDIPPQSSWAGNHYPVLAIYDVDTQAWEVVDLTATLLWSVEAMCVVGTDLYFGAQGTGSGYIKKYDTLTGTISDLTGTALSASWNNDGGRVEAIVFISGFLYIAGWFDDANGLSVKNLVAYDVNYGTWDDFGGGITSGTVETTVANSLLVNGSDLIIGFSGTELGGVSCNHIGVWSSGSFSPLGGGLDGTSYALAMLGSNIVAGGVFTGRISMWDGAAWSVLGGGTTGGYVDSLSVHFADLIVGGNFTDRGNHIARYSGGSWGHLDTGVDGNVYSTIVVDDDFYVTGTFDNAGGKTAKMVAAYFMDFNALTDYLENSSANSFNMGAAIHNAKASAITDNDEVPFWEDVSKALRKITWASMKSGIGAAPATTAANDFQVGDGAGAWIKKTLAETVTILQTLLDGVYLKLSSMSAAQAALLVGGGATILHTHAGREVLTAARTYYVRTDGNNANTGLANTSGGAFLTIQNAIDVSASLDTSLYNIIIQVGDGTYVEPITMKNILGSGGVTIQGNTGNMDAVVIDGGFAKITVGTIYTVQYFKMTKVSGTSASAFRASGYAKYNISNINFSTGYTSHINIETQANIVATSSYTISGGTSFCHILLVQGNFIQTSATITLSGTPALGYYVYCTRLSFLRAEACTFSGSATGTRYSADANSIVFTLAATTFLPGNIAGTLSTGAQYV